MRPEEKLLLKKDYIKLLDPPSFNYLRKNHGKNLQNFLKQFFRTLLMSFYFTDRDQRSIFLSSECITHLSKHIQVSTGLHLIESSLRNPDFINTNSVFYYHKYLKNEHLYFIIAVKILNAHGFIITAFKSPKQKE